MISQPFFMAFERKQVYFLWTDRWLEVLIYIISQTIANGLVEW